MPNPSVKNLLSDNLPHTPNQENTIRIRGARQHNLKNIDLDLPRDQLIVFTGVSGSGKSSLAFDTIFAEGQRRYVESLSAYARQFLGQLDKPDVESIEGLSPAISLIKNPPPITLVPPWEQSQKSMITCDCFMDELVNPIVPIAIALFLPRPLTRCAIAFYHFLTVLDFKFWHLC